MAYVSFTFLVNPGRVYRVMVSGANLEIKSIAATALEVWVVDSSANPPIETRVLRDDIKLGTSIIVGPKNDLQFVNTSSQARPAYFGANT